MKYRTRKLLFLSFALLFFISIVPIVLFTQGFRLDTESLSLKKTGGLDINISTPATKIFLNNKLTKETNFIFKKVIFRNILPGNYNIKIEKENYFSWEKSISVLEGHVSKFPYVRLFQKDLDTGILMRDIKNIYISPDGSSAIIQTNFENEANKIKTSQLIFYNFNVRLPGYFYILKKGEKLENILWSSDSSTFALITKDAKKTYIYTSEASPEPHLTDWTKFLTKSYPVALNKDSFILPTSSVTTLNILTKNNPDSFSLNRIELENTTINSNIVTGILGFKIIDDNIFFIDTFGSLKKTNVVEGTTEEITPTSISKPSLEGTEILVRNDQQALIIINNGSIFIWQDKKPLEKIGHSVVGASFSPDKDKVLFWTKDNQVVVYWLKKVFGPPKKLIGDIERFEIKNLIKPHWINNESSHLLMQTQNGLKFIELDSRDTANTATYTKKTDQNILQLNLQKQELYTISKEGHLIFLGFSK